MLERLVVYDPVAEIAVTEAKPLRPVEALRAGRMGLIWGGHGSTSKFWPILAETVQKMYEPKEVYKIYKHSTWNPAPMDEMEDMASKIDYAIIGIGA